MRRIVALWFLLGVPSAFLAQAVKPYFMNAGAIEHNGATGALTSNDPRPLRQAIEAISQEYGWTVDFEDPPYRSGFDLVDDTDPKWRAAHPTAKGVTRVAGGSFQSNFPEPSTISPDDAEEQVLKKLVADYNSSGNPGKFAVRKEAEGRYAVVGVSRKDDAGKDEAVDVLLDTSISIPVEQRDAGATLRLILDTLSATSGVKVYLGTVGFSSDPLQGVEVTIGGSNVPARTLLLQTLDGVSVWTPPHGGQFFRGILVWNLLFDADRNGYRLGLSSATKTETDANGRRVIRFLKHK